MLPSQPILGVIIAQKQANREKISVSSPKKVSHSPSNLIRANFPKKTVPEGNGEDTAPGTLILLIKFQNQTLDLSPCYAQSTHIAPLVPNPNLSAICERFMMASFWAFFRFSIFWAFFSCEKFFEFFRLLLAVCYLLSLS